MNNTLMCRVWDKVDNAYWSEKTIKANAEWLLFPNDNIENVIVERATGLKDKNGNLIYESDIIQNSDKDQYVVEWCIDGYWYIRLADDEKFGCALASIKTLYDGWKIIGNIHETKDNK